ncbi:MAG: tellurite resistance TerB C-terminal domain-containing protein, partial [Ignavibacteria bacterium]
DYDTKIEKNENENKIKDVLINANDNLIDNSQIIEVRPKNDILEIIKNDLFNIKKYNNQTSGISEEKKDDTYPNNNHELQNFWLKLPWKPENKYIYDIQLSEKLLDEIYIKIIEIYDDLYKLNGSDIVKALRLDNKLVSALIKYKEEERIQNCYYNLYDDMYHFNKILNISNYSYDIAKDILKLKYDFQINITKYLSVLRYLDLEKYREKVRNSLIKLIQDIPDPDEETEVEINKFNRIRWKIYFNKIKEKKDNNNADKKEILTAVRKLISQNKKNYNLKNIYFSSSKLLVDISVLESAYYYALYKILSVKSGVEVKPIPSALKKAILKYENGTLIEYDTILVGTYNLNTKRDNKKLLNDIQKLFVKERKTIDIDKTKVLVAEEEHIRIKNKLDKILSTEEQPIINEEKVHDNILVGDNIKNTTDASLIDDIRKTLIHNIIEKGNSISEKELMEYAYQYKLPHNFLVNSINEYFFERFDDNLINEENSIFILNTDYINEITKLINND